MNEAGVLIGWASKNVNSDSSNTSFPPAPIGNQGTIPATASNIAAVWDRDCEQCSSTLNLAYQGGNGQIIYGNLSGTGWSFNPIPISPAIGTGLALDIRFLAGGGRDLVLYHQTAAGNLSHTVYNSAYDNTGKLAVSARMTPYARAKVLKVLDGC